MFELKNILKANRATFYDYRTGERRSVLPKIALIVFASIILSSILRAGTDNFLSGVITLQSILIGFGFNVVFFIGSNRSIQVRNSDSLEENLRRLKEKKVTEELFDNICYFLLVAIVCVLIALSLLLSGQKNTVWTSLMASAGKLMGNWPRQISKIAFILPYVMPACFYFFLIESIHTFYRSIARVRFLFQR